MPAYKLNITGKVQGVWFRAYTQKEAKHLGLTGTVRNLQNGDVEIIAQGPTEQIEKLRKWCNHGSPNSQVKKVTFQSIHTTQTYKNFSIKT